MTKLTAEKVTVESLITPALQEDMDWAYFNLVSGLWANILQQLTCAREIINDHNGLEVLPDSQISSATPILAIDSDFEFYGSEDFSEQEITLRIQWQEEGRQWSQVISKHWQGQYLPSIDSSHLVVLEHPLVILDALAHLLE